MIWLALAIAAGIFLYFAYGLHVIGLLPRNISQYFDEPEERWAWGIRLVAGGLGMAGVVDLWWYGGALFYNAFSVEMIVGAVTVLFLDELNRLRSKAEYKKSIIRQMASRSNDFALDAARIAKDEGWLFDGSLVKANLQTANLQGADLLLAYLKDANLSGVHLQRANLSVAKLQGAHFLAADLQGANLSSANLQGAYLGFADLQEANLSSANLQGANLGYANLQGVNLSSANLQEVRLVGADLNGAMYNRHTIWPDGFDPVVVGTIPIPKAPMMIDSATEATHRLYCAHGGCTQS